MVCGNGGSAADAGHIVGELMKGFLLPRPLPADLRQRLEGSSSLSPDGYAGRLQGTLPALDLTAQIPLLTAIGNDLGGDLVFAQQVLGYGRPGDLLLAISTSGRARNVLNAMRAAHGLGLVTVGLSGQSGGEMPACCRVLIRVPAQQTAEIQELHLPVYHTLCAMVEEHFFAEMGQPGAGFPAPP
jgi:D-sedoheptulose 7-phosphate isomerase